MQEGSGASGDKCSWRCYTPQSSPQTRWSSPPPPPPPPPPPNQISTQLLLNVSVSAFNSCFSHKVLRHVMWIVWNKYLQTSRGRQRDHQEQVQDQVQDQVLLFNAAFGFGVGAEWMDSLKSSVHERNDIWRDTTGLVEGPELFQLKYTLMFDWDC